MDQSASGVRELAIVTIVVADGQNGQAHRPCGLVRQTVADVIACVDLFYLDYSCFPRQR